MMTKTFAGSDVAMEKSRFFSLAPPVVGGLILGVLCIMSPAHVSAGDCMECHKKHGVVIRVPDVQPIKVKTGGKERSLTLQGAYKFHGHECPGITIAYRAMQYGLDLLFPGETPDSDDLLITSRTSAAGVKDFIDLVMRGDDPANKTWPAVGMKTSRDGFDFLMVRKSTCQAVEIQLNQDNFPEDFYPLKKKEKDKTITVEEWNRLHGYMKNIILAFPVTPPEKLFGKPEPYKMLVWGDLLPGEQDGNIRKMRQAEKKKALQAKNKERAL